MTQTGGGGAPAVFALDRLADYSPDALSAELRRVAAMVDGPTLTIGQFQARSRVSYNTLWQRFGGWRQALERAGLGHRYGGRPVTEKMRRREGRRMSDAELIDALRAAARRKKTRVLRVQDLDQECPIGYHVVASRFGSWAEALARAGLEQHRTGRRYADRTCFENLRRVWLHYGRAPRCEEMMRPPSQVGMRAYVRRFGTWRKALAAFVAWANAPAEANACPPAGAPAAVPPAAVPPAPPPEDRRRVPLALRFQVLQRDRYACCACGDSPTKNKRCTLEVDHVVPFARGGKTVIENLRTLCGRCNRGKGARPPAANGRKGANGNGKKKDRTARSGPSGGKERGRRW